MSTRIYYGDLRLWGTPNAPMPVPGRTVTQEFPGVDQDLALVWPASPNAALDLECGAVGALNVADITRSGLLALKRAMWADYVARARRLDPVVFVDDDSTAKTASGFTAGAIQCSGHGFSNGDIVLVRRDGAGNYTLGQVGSVAGGSFVATPVHGTITAHVPQSGDTIVLVSAYWCRMVWMGIQATDEGWYLGDVTYQFRGAPTTAMTYARAS